MRELLSSALAMEPETIRCPECEGLGYTTYLVREPDGIWWTKSKDCHVCNGAKRVLRDGTPIERRVGR